ncbi:PAS-domain containing protein [Roseivivax sp. GX 12232]|uniref:PAS-domain containing protein n=1 Tax=Roseivivax sp. GX 12232 TaxID=2900547 RepID=UPI001E5F3FCC|nr:PAS-domain containing protein [Roseivivax sp. GX 12232]MCE0505065.1 PAS-domain containing protein [Roseivivax sp. GX 12232]
MRASILKTSWRHAVVAAELVVVILVATAFTVSLLVDRQRAEQELQTREQAEMIRAELDASVQQILQAARGVATAIARDTTMDQEVFARIARSFSPEGPSDNRLRLINIGASDGYVIRYVYPLEGNTSVLGVDYRDLPGQLPNVEAAMRSDDVVMMAPVNLIQGGRGIIARIGVTEIGGDEVFGVVGVVALLEDLFSGAVEMARTAKLELAISKQEARQEGRQQMYGPANPEEGEPVMVQLVVPDGLWYLSVVPSEGWPTWTDFAGRILLGYFGIGALVFMVYLLLDRAARARRSAEEQLTTAIESIDDGFALYDPEDRLVLCNETYRRYYPRSARIIQPGVRFQDLLEYGVARGEYADAKGREPEYIRERLNARMHPERHFIHELAGGRWIKVSDHRLSDGSTVGLRVDITELVEARRAAEAGSRAKSVFLDRMSHELRTPLAVLMGSAAFLERPERLATRAALAARIEGGELTAFEGEITGHAGRIGKSARHLMALIDRLLDVARAEREAPDSGEVLLGELLEEQRTLFDAALPRGMTLDLRHAKGPLPVPYGETVRNALGAILRHGRDGFAESKAELSVAATDRHVSLAFVISGKRTEPVLTERFFGPASDDLDRAGAADLTLDLAVAERLVSRAGGTFRYRKVNESKDFVDITFPRRKDEDLVAVS